MKITDTFRILKGMKEGAFIPYITAGYPNPEFTSKLGRTILDKGGDILEIGIPFSDPIADGTTLQSGHERALKAGMNIKKTFSVVEDIRQHTAKPLVFMSYYNIPLQYGLKSFFKRMEDTGVEGVIFPDLPVEESNVVIDIANKYEREIIFLVAPTTTEKRLQKIKSLSMGFIYLVSVLGVTGARQSLENITLETLTNVKQVIGDKIPVSVGFGISNPYHVKEVINAGADGVIVGSALVDLLLRDTDEKTKLEDISKYITLMKTATRK